MSPECTEHRSTHLAHPARSDSSGPPASTALLHRRILRRVFHKIEVVAVRRRRPGQHESMRKLFADIERLGGLASSRELRSLGHDRWSIEIPLLYGNLVRVRHGWFALPGEHVEIMRAWRVGGRLACLSALAWHGGRPFPAELHVEVPGNAARLRSPDDARRSLGAHEPVVVHWARRPGDGDRRSVGVRAAWAAATRCAVATCCDAATTAQAASESASRIV